MQKWIKKIIYGLCLFGVFLSGSSVIAPFYSLLISFAPFNTVGYLVLSKCLAFIGSFIFMLVLFRILSSIKMRAFEAPETFSGPIFFYSAIVVLPAMVPLLLLTFTGNMSYNGGATLGDLIRSPSVYSMLLAIPIILCESPMFYQALPHRDRGDLP